MTEEVFKKILEKHIQSELKNMEELKRCRSIDDLIRYYYGAAKSAASTFEMLDEYAENREVNEAFFNKVDTIYSKNPI